MIGVEYIVLNVTSPIVVIFVFLLWIVFFQAKIEALSEDSDIFTYSGTIAKLCTLNINNYESTVRQCFAGYHNVDILQLPQAEESFNTEVIKYKLNSSVNYTERDESRIMEQNLVSPIPQKFRDNIGEPTFGSNGNVIFFAGNYYAARSSDGGKNWQSIDPRRDFPNDTKDKKSTFCCDQKVTYDNDKGLYIWYRQGHEMKTNNQNKNTNIGRLAVSSDTVIWHVYDLLADRNVPHNSNISRGAFDFPELSLSREYLYLSTNYIDKSGNSQTVPVQNSKSGYYGMVFRFLLDDLSEFGELSYDGFLDKESFGIFPAHGFDEKAYFVAHGNDNQPAIRLYAWNESSNTIDTHVTKFNGWNEIRKSKSCLDQIGWWCYAEISSKIRSAWMEKNDSISILWSSIAMIGNGEKWIPYIEAATCNLKENLSHVSCERGPYVAENNNPWMYGAAIPNDEGKLGMVAFYGDNVKTPITLAFGTYNYNEKMWEMMPLVSSTGRLPIVNENRLQEYNIGDFLTIKKHIGNEIGSGSWWDAAGYIINGTAGTDVEPYFFILK